MNKTIDNSWSKDIQRKVADFSIAAQYYIFLNLFENALDIAEFLGDEGERERRIIETQVNIEVKKFEMFPYEDCYKSLNKEIRMEKKTRKSDKKNEE